MRRSELTGAIFFLAVATSSSPVRAQLPPGIFSGERDLKGAAAGTYVVDPSHTAVIAKVSHIGYGLSVFRFDKVDGTLTWNPAKPESSSLKAVVHTVSISTPVPGFAHELAGKGYLNADQFPDATFVSTAFRQIDPTHGKVDGQFTLLGKTKAASFDVVLQGAGKGFMGHPRIGVTATGHIDPKDFGLAAMLGPRIVIEIDAEFEEGS